MSAIRSARAPRRERARRRRATLALVVAALGAAAVVAALRPGAEAVPRPWDCVSANDLTTLARWSRVLGRPVECAVAFIDAAPTWRAWEDPWIVGYRAGWAKYDWVDWYHRGRHGRHLILTLSLIPSDERGADWLAAGAAGDYQPYARALARRLVAAGMGSAVIRLAHEANGTWYPDSIPWTPRGDAEWVRFWRQTVTAMRSVRGARFRFDWTVNAGVRPIPLRDFYPGDGYVDVIGVDAYDSLPQPLPAGRLRQQRLFEEPDGLAAVAAFARRHGKPMSIPEWGIGPPGSGGTIGDDPGYVDAMGRFVRRERVLYQSYFTGGAEGTALLASPRSLAAYRRHFGPHGDAAPPVGGG